MKVKLAKTANKQLGDRIKRQLERKFQKEAVDTYVKNKIQEAFRWSGNLNPNRIVVSVHDGTVELWGSVGTWAEMREAERISLAVPGVSKVDAHLYIAR
jgi:osmotically-inducible protein OsmY